MFSAGLTIERHVSRRSWTSISLLLTVVMPLTILAIAGFGMLAMGLSFGGALLLGAVLASARSASSEPPRRWRTRFTTPPASASASLN